MRHPAVLGLIGLAACTGPTPADDTEPSAIDLSEPLGPGEVRAGVVTDEAALFGGVSAEGQLGDIKLYNQHVRFIVQAARPGSYYVVNGGGIIDADIARADDAPGRDIVDEWLPLIGLGQVIEPTAVEVIADGSDGLAAVVRVTGVQAPLDLIEGAIEAPGFLRTYPVELMTEYRLEPDSHLLEVTTEVTATGATRVDVGDVLFGAPEVADAWYQGSGRLGDDGDRRLWSGYLGAHNDVAVGMFAGPGADLGSESGVLLAELAELVVGFAPTLDLAEGDVARVTRWYGVGPDMATLTDEALARRGEVTEPYSDAVTAGDGPVAGAQVHVLVDGAPYTVAVSAADGSFTAQVPAGSYVSAVAVGRGTGLFMDAPDGAAPFGAYAAPSAQQLAVAALQSGGPVVPSAVGRGVGDPASPLTLGQPGVLRVTAVDGLPFAARVQFTAGDVAVDPRIAPGRPSGYAAAGFSRDGTLDLLVEPGDYTLVTHRGLRFEVDTEAVTVTAGQTTEVAVEMPAAYAHAGWLLADPHAHAAPSGDASITMEDRLVVHAATGVQVHFGTDHDHLADYRPLIPALGLSGILTSVVADEVSPPLRGHFNIYPVDPKPEPNGGAWPWWTDIPSSTEAMVDTLRARHGDRFILQSNHPTDSGMGSAASWLPGQVRNGNAWSSRIEAVEVLNAMDYADYLAFYLDLVHRGQLITPIGVSDSHTHFGGNPGMSATFLHVGLDDPSALTDDGLAAAMRARATIVTRGPFLDTSVRPGLVLTAPTEVTVTARGPSWIGVDRLILLRDGAEVDRIDGDTGSFALGGDADAVFVVIAEGDTPMQPVTGHTPWAMTSPWLYDADGDGFEAPLPPLEIDGR